MQVIDHAINQHHQPHDHQPLLHADDGAVDADLRGPTLHYFAMALTIGICFGIYSSVFVPRPSRCGWA